MTQRYQLSPAILVQGTSKLYFSHFVTTILVHLTTTKSITDVLIRKLQRKHFTVQNRRRAVKIKMSSGRKRTTNRTRNVIGNVEELVVLCHDPQSHVSVDCMVQDTLNRTRESQNQLLACYSCFCIGNLRYDSICYNYLRAPLC